METKSPRDINSPSPNYEYQAYNKLRDWEDETVEKFENKEYEEIKAPPGTLPLVFIVICLVCLLIFV